MTQLSISLLVLLATNPLDAVGAAKAVVAAHERIVASGDLDAIMTNVAEDVVVLVPDTPLVKGKGACRELYKNFLAAGRWDFAHEYDGASATGDAVVLHGVARGTLSPSGQPASRFANNFVLVLKKQADGKFRLWRVAFAPSAK
jgi:ketosteroid isomerase-like protein